MTKSRLSPGEASAGAAELDGVAGTGVEIFVPEHPVHLETEDSTGYLDQYRPIIQARKQLILEAKDLAVDLGDVHWRDLFPPEFFANPPQPNVAVNIQSQANHSNNVNNHNEATGNKSTNTQTNNR